MEFDLVASGKKYCRIAQEQVENIKRLKRSKASTDKGSTAGTTR